MAGLLRVVPVSDHTHFHKRAIPRLFVPALRHIHSKPHWCRVVHGLPFPRGVFAVLYSSGASRALLPATVFGKAPLVRVSAVGHGLELTQLPACARLQHSDSTLPFYIWTISISLHPRCQPSLYWPLLSLPLSGRFDYSNFLCLELPPCFVLANAIGPKCKKAIKILLMRGAFFPPL